MLKNVLLTLAVSSFIFSSCSNSGKVGKVTLKNEADSAAYAIGQAVGSNVGRDGMTELDLDIFMKAFAQGLAGEESQIPILDGQMIIRSYATKMRAKLAEKNKKAGEDFLAENKKKDGVKTTESGLQYQVIKEGEGKQPNEDSYVSVHYKGTLINGEEFDSSYERQKPAEFQLKRVIKGWTEGLQLMKEGAKYKLFIPSELAYGARGAGAQIKAHSTLIFEVELLKVMTPDEYKAKKEAEKKEAEKKNKKKASKK